MCADALPDSQPRRVAFQYAIVRVVPDVERGECLNVGILLLCRPRRYLGALLEVDAEVVRAVAPTCDPDALEPHLDAIRRICAGDVSAGPIATLSRAERFHWLTSPASTVVQPSEVHTGLTDDPARTLAHLFHRLVRRSRP